MRFHLFAIAFLIALVTSCPCLLAQEAEQNSKQESEAIAQIKATGGNVMQISAADSTKEVSFYLAGKKIKDEQLKPVAAIGEVVWLNLANTGITDAGLKSISGLNLKKLHLEKTEIGDEGLVHLKGMKELEYLNLYATSVTDAGLKHLGNLKQLKRLYVWQSKVTEEGMQALEKKIPGLKVVGQSKLPVAAEKAQDSKKAEATKAKAEATKAKETTKPAEEVPKAKGKSKAETGTADQ